MKNRWISIVISLALALTISLSFVVGVFAQSVSLCSDSAILSTHVRNVLPLIYDEPLSSEDSIAIGDEIREYFLIDGSVEESNLDAYPILVNDQIVGIIKAARSADNSISQVSVGKEYSYELQSTLENHPDLPFALLHTNEGVFIKYSSYSDCVPIKSFSSNLQPRIELPVTELEYARMTYQCTVAYIEQPLVAAANMYRRLNVTRVPNTSTSCCTSGICWAACMAMMSNYFRGTSYTALNVHDLMGCVPAGVNYHTTHREYISQLGLTVNGTYSGSSSRPFAFDSVCYWIDWNNLLLVDLQPLSGSNRAHDVLCHGYYSSAQNATYCYLMDPNYGSVLCSVPETASSAITVSLRNTSYTVHCYIAVSG